MPAPSRPARSRFGPHFTRFAKWTSQTTGRPATFLVAVLLIIGWALTGPMFHYSDTWQLVINTGTTIITFLMVFLIQSTQNRDSQALHMKLDELIRAIAGARNSLIDIDNLSDEELETLHTEYLRLAEKAKKKVGRRHERQKFPSVAAGR